MKMKARPLMGGQKFSIETNVGGSRVHCFTIIFQNREDRRADRLQGN